MEQEFEVPNNTLLIIPELDIFKDTYKEVVESLKGNKTRNWFIPHAYMCLPLVVGNEHGFLFKSLYNFRCMWKGGDKQEDVVCEILDTHYTSEQKQIIKSHFGMGTVTIQNRFTLRTPRGINLITINPPNMWIDGIHYMTGVIETDNLRRDFSFSLRITRQNEWITINKGDPIGCVLPYPRRFIDDIQIKNAYDVLDSGDIYIEQTVMRDSGHERKNVDQHTKRRAGRRYFRGEDVYGNKFPDHQRKLGD